MFPITALSAMATDPDPDELAVTITAVDEAYTVDEITIHAAATGGTAEEGYKYAFDYKKGSAAAWTSISAFSESDNCTYTFASDGTYTLRARVKDDNGDIAESTKTITIDPYTPLAVNMTVSYKQGSSFYNYSNLEYGQYTGVQFRFYGTGSGGHKLTSTAYKYAFDYCPDGGQEWISVADYSTTNRVLFTFEEAGTYNVRCRVKDEADFIAESVQQVLIVPAPENKSTISATSVQTGESVTITGACSGLRQDDEAYYNFKYKLKTSSSWKECTNDDDLTGTFTPSVSGVYDVVSILMTYETSLSIEKSFDVTVGGSLQASIKDVDRPNYTPDTLIQAGTSLHVKAAADGGDSSNGYTYAFYKMEATDTPENAVQAGTASWTLVKDFSTADNVTLTMPSAKILWVKAVVKDSTGATAEARMCYNYKRTLSAPSVTADRMVISKDGAKRAYASITLSGGVKDFYDKDDEEVVHGVGDNGVYSVITTVYYDDGAQFTRSGMSPKSYDFKDGNLIVQLTPTNFTNPSTSQTVSGYYDIKFTVYDAAGLYAECRLNDFCVVDTPTLTVRTNTVSGDNSIVGGRILASVSVTSEHFSSSSYTYQFYSMYADSLPDEAIASGDAEWSFEATNTSGSFVTNRTAEKVLWIRAFVTDDSGQTAESVAGFNYSSPLSVELSSSANSVSAADTDEAAFTVHTQGGQKCLYSAATNTISKYNNPTGLASYVLEITGDNNFSKTVEFDMDNLTFDSQNNVIFTLKGTDFDYTPGTYDLTMKVTDLKTTSQATITGFTVRSSASELSNLSTVTPDTIIRGEILTINAAASGGTPGYTYALYAKKSTDKDYINLREYTTDTVLTFKPAHAADYNIKVVVKDSTGKTVEKVFTRTILPSLRNDTVVTPEVIGKGGSFTINAAASYGTPEYTYKVYVKKASDKNYTTLKDFCSDTTFTFKPGYATNYNIKVKVKDSTGKVVEKIFTRTVNPPLRNNSEVTPDSVYQGGSFTINAAAEGGVPGYTYAVYVKKSSVTNYTTLSGFTDKTTFTFKPAYATNYDIKVKVKDSTGKVVSKLFTKTVYRTLTNTTVIPYDTVAQGDCFTIYASATGGFPDYTYAVYVKQSTASNYTTLRTYTSESTFTFKPAHAVSYDIKVKVKDSNGKIAEKVFTKNVNPPLRNVSTLSSDTIVHGSYFTINAAATGGIPGYTYAAYIKKPSDKKYTLKRDYGTDPTIKIWPGFATDYSVKVYVKDLVGKVASSVFTVKVLPVLKNVSTITPDTIALGKSFTINAAAEGGIPGYTYAVYVKESSETTYTTLSGYTSESTFTFKPANAASYDIKVKVKDSTGKVVSKEFTKTVTAG